VIDRGCVIPEGMVIGENAVEDARRFYRSEEGIVLVTKEMLENLRYEPICGKSVSGGRENIALSRVVSVAE
jgi:hypothetical protein